MGEGGAVITQKKCRFLKYWSLFVIGEETVGVMQLRNRFKMEEGMIGKNLPEAEGAEIYLFTYRFE